MGFGSIGSFFLEGRIGNLRMGFRFGVRGVLVMLVFLSGSGKCRWPSGFGFGLAAGGGVVGYRHDIY